MRRLMLLAIGLSALVWTATARVESAQPDDWLTISEVAPSLSAVDSPQPSDSDQQWRGRQQAIAAVTESVWKFAPVHAELAATRATRVFDPVCPASSPDPPVRVAPYYLRHTPLLI